MAQGWGSGSGVGQFINTQLWHRGMGAWTDAGEGVMTRRGQDVTIEEGGVWEEESAWFEGEVRQRQRDRDRQGGRHIDSHRGRQRLRDRDRETETGKQRQRQRQREV